MQRVCANCEWFSVIEANQDWSEVTPGNQFSLSCQKDHWRFDAYDLQPDTMIKIFTAAKQCPDYREKDER